VKKGWGIWHKWKTYCPASERPSVQTSEVSKTKKYNTKKLPSPKKTPKNAIFLRMAKVRESECV
jgi:hypothetical protein